MKRPKNAIEHDERTIRCIFAAGDRGGSWQVGHRGVTRITVTLEPGQGAYVPWFAVWQGEHLSTRVNAAHVENVVYADPGPDGGP